MFSAFGALVARLVTIIFPFAVEIQPLPTKTVPWMVALPPAGSGVDVSGGDTLAPFSIDCWRICGVVLVALLLTALLELTSWCLGRVFSLATTEAPALTCPSAPSIFDLLSENDKLTQALATVNAALDDSNKRAGHAEIAQHTVEREAEEKRQQLQSSISVLEARCAELQRANATLESQAATETGVFRTGLALIGQRIQTGEGADNRPQAHEGDAEAGGVGESSPAADAVFECDLEGAVSEQLHGLRRQVERLTGKRITLVYESPRPATQAQQTPTSPTSSVFTVVTTTSAASTSTVDASTTVDVPPSGSKYEGMTKSQKRRLQRAANLRQRREAEAEDQQ